MTKTSWNIPYLPAGKEIFVVPSTDQFMIRAAWMRNHGSTDLRHSTGAVVVKNGVILGEAANQAGFKHPKLIQLHSKGMCVRIALKVKSGTKYWLCPGCSTHQDHAESGAVKDAVAKAGVDEVRGADVYLYGHYWACKPCWDNMLKAGVERLFVVEDAFNLFGRK